MEVRTDFPSSMYHTKLQWAQLGKALNADAVGTEMWINSCQINSAIFYTVDEVHNGTQTELDEVLEPLRKKAEASRAARLREKEERLIAREKRISDSAQQRGIKKVLSLLAAAMPQAAVPEAQAIVIDTETTGLTDSDELLQISVIDDAGTVLSTVWCARIFIRSGQKRRKLMVLRRKWSQVRHIHMSCYRSL